MSDIIRPATLYTKELSRRYHWLTSKDAVQWVHFKPDFRHRKVDSRGLRQAVFDDQAYVKREDTELDGPTIGGNWW